MPPTSAPRAIASYGRLTSPRSLTTAAALGSPAQQCAGAVTGTRTRLSPGHHKLSGEIKRRHGDPARPYFISSGAALSLMASSAAELSRAPPPRPARSDLFNRARARADLPADRGSSLTFWGRARRKFGADVYGRACPDGSIPGGCTGQVRQLAADSVGGVDRRSIMSAVASFRSVHGRSHRARLRFA